MVKKIATRINRSLRGIAMPYNDSVYISCVYNIFRNKSVPQDNLFNCLSTLQSVPRLSPFGFVNRRNNCRIGKTIQAVNAPNSTRKNGRKNQVANALHGINLLKGLVKHS